MNAKERNELYESIISLRHAEVAVEFDCSTPMVHRYIAPNSAARDKVGARIPTIYFVHYIAEKMNVTMNEVCEAMEPLWGRLHPVRPTGERFAELISQDTDIPTVEKIDLRRSANKKAIKKTADKTADKTPVKKSAKKSAKKPEKKLAKKKTTKTASEEKVINKKKTPAKKKKKVASKKK